MSNKKYKVEGYNVNDYISDFPIWELLKVFDNRFDAYDFLTKKESNSYKCRIIETIEETDSTLENCHWEIFVGID